MYSAKVMDHFQNPRNVGEIENPTSSMITELVKGKTLEQAQKISRKTVAEALDGLPAPKMHCSNLAADALQSAIEDYKSKKKDIL
jgi:nitrogen fixation NifU-like protein